MKDWDEKRVYRVWYGSKLEHEAFFTEKTAAETFCKTVNGHLNIYKWIMCIEP